MIIVPARPLIILPHFTQKTPHVNDSGWSNQVFQALSSFRENIFTFYQSNTIFLHRVFSLWEQLKIHFYSFGIVRISPISIWLLFKLSLQHEKLDILYLEQVSLLPFSNVLLLWRLWHFSHLSQESYVWKMYQERSWEFFPVGDCFRKQYEDQLGWRERRFTLSVSHHWCRPHLHTLKADPVTPERWNTCYF